MAEYFELDTVRPVRPVRPAQGPGSRDEGRRRRSETPPSTDSSPEGSPRAKDPPAADGRDPQPGKGDHVDEYV